MSTAASDGLYFSSLALAIDYDFVSRQPFYQYASHYFTKSSFTLQTQITHHHQHFRDNSRNKIGSSTSNVSGLNSADGTRIASALALNFATNTARLLHHHNDSTCQPYCLTFALLCCTIHITAASTLFSCCWDCNLQLHVHIAVTRQWHTSEAP